MSLILQLETSSDVCSVALSLKGKLVIVIESDQPNSHTEKLTLLIQECLAQAGYTISQLDAVAVSDGPGSYTSLRVGISVAKGICYAKDIPMIALDSLLILAQGIDKRQIEKEDLIIPMIDARRMEVYTSVFNYDLLRVQETVALIIENNPFAALISDNRKINICGSGSIKYYEHHKSEAIKLHHTKTSSSFMSLPSYDNYIINQFVDVAYYTPNYFKAPNITKSKSKLL